ncbi:unnamed protein product [Urochloa humidicola]
MIEPWSSSLGAKGELQQAWFKVKGIPPDQRGTRTIAKVGGLVGKTVAIDESTRFKPEFVRIKIACINIYEVPDSAESSLGMFLHDFFYELEDPDNYGAKTQKAQVKTSEENNQSNPERDVQPSPKKMKTSSSEFTTSSAFNTSGRSGFSNKVCAKSAPCKFSKGNVSTAPVIPVDIQLNDMEDGEVIPAATYEPSKDLSDNEDSEVSGEFAHQVSQAFGDKEMGDKSVWQFSCTTFYQKEGLESEGKQMKSGVRISEIVEDDVVDPANQKQDSLEACELNLRELSNPCEIIKAQHEDRRWSKRIQQLKEEGKGASCNKKRTAEGLHKEEFHGKLLEGVQVLLSCAHKAMARCNKPARLMLLPPDDQDQDADS